MKGLIKKAFFFIFSFLIGFVFATFWSGGRDLVETFMPFAEKHVERTLDQGTNMLEKAEDKLKESMTQ